MRKISINYDSNFKVLESTPRSQIAEMVLKPGASTGGSDNNHSNSDQWLVITEGEGKAVIEGKEINFRSGDIILIEAGENHKITNTGNQELKTFSMYAPNVY